MFQKYINELGISLSLKNEGSETSPQTLKFR